MLSIKHQLSRLELPPKTLANGQVANGGQSMTIRQANTSSVLLLGSSLSISIPSCNKCQTNNDHRQDHLHFLRTSENFISKIEQVNDVKTFKKNAQSSGKKLRTKIWNGFGSNNLVKFIPRPIFLSFLLWIINLTDFEGSIMTTSEVYDLPPGFDEEPASDATKLAQLFDENAESHDHELDFRFNPSSDKLITKPRSRLSEPAKTAAEDVVVAVFGPVPVDFPQFGTHMCSISVVNGENLFLNNVVETQFVTKIPISSCSVQISGNDVVLHQNGSVFCRFECLPELCAKLMAIFSSYQPVDPWIISGGSGETAIQDCKIQFSQISFEFTTHELKPRAEDAKKQLYLNAENIQDPFLRQFLGKKPGSKFVVGSNGIGTYFELKKLRTKKPRNVSPAPSESSETVQTTPVPDRSTDMKERMKKIGAIPLISMESQVSVPQYETPPDVSVLEQPQEEDNKQRADSIKPIPAARSTSTTTSNNQSDTLLSMEKRLEECERKLAALSSRPETTSGVGTSLNFDRYEFAMDVYVKVAASETIPAAVKTEIKKLLLSAAIES